MASPVCRLGIDALRSQCILASVFIAFGRPLTAGNKSTCDASGHDCSLDGSIVDWDYAWEPVKPRRQARKVKFDASRLPPKRASGPLDWAIGW